LESPLNNFSEIDLNFLKFFNDNQQDAIIFDYLVLKGSTCFVRFIVPSSGARNCTPSFTYCQPLLLQAGTVDDVELFHLIHYTSLQQYWLTIPEAGMQ